MIRGPLEYVPPVEVEVVTKRKAIPLDENEGIYVRHIKSGKVKFLISIVDGNIIFKILSLGPCCVWVHLYVDSRRGIME